MTPPDWPSWFAGLHRATAAAARPEVYGHLEPARGLINQHFDEPLDLPQIAASAAFSPYHFQRLFNRTYGESPHRYLTRTRLAAARRLLEQTDRPVTQICFDVGFHSPGSFSTLFRESVGHPPSRYRARWYRGADLPPPVWVPGCFASRILAARGAQDRRSNPAAPDLR